MSDPLMIVENLYCERDDRVLFEDLGFSLMKGEVLQIEGQNGSGKTTLLRILAGLSSHFEGDIYWRGLPLMDVQDDFRRDMLYFGHQPGVKAMLSPEENLRWYAAMHPAIDLDRMATALDAVGLNGYEDVPCHSLSAGQHRRVSLARLYMTAAPLWILDEPFTAIDKAGVAKQEMLIQRHAELGGSVILTTHHELHLGSHMRRINLDQLAGT
ncbi:cytochrome c biogenesis heme-transporting ATPase CcmA [Marinobacterium jannaschii]|uniref:cytochrome c biogenesis heme-transporting ATPase CcmA n=1 Tax=Marinobacterium jannaschii TaxID=64970 RepID=UPI0004858917